jgi:hypothetical protein
MRQGCAVFGAGLIAVVLSVAQTRIRLLPAAVVVAPPVVATLWMIRRRRMPL